jgi:hypothetical protein
VVAGILVLKTRSAFKPSDGRRAIAECYDAWESAVLGRRGFKLDFQVDIDRHNEKFERVIDSLVTIQYARPRDPYAPRPRVFQSPMP